MSTVNFSVPDDVKDEFDGGHVTYALGCGGVPRRERAPGVTEASFRKAREKGRP